jgi:parvulin-like peptidyl-prolyl isomerase
MSRISFVFLTAKRRFRKMLLPGKSLGPVIVISAAMMLLSGLLPIECPSETLDKVIVVVDGETITQSEYDVAAAAMLERLNSTFKGPELAEELEIGKKELLNRMIEEKLILSKAKKENIEASDAEIDDKLNEVKSRFDSDEKFIEILQEEGVSVSELRQRYADQIKVTKLVEMEVRKKIIVTPSEIAEYYDAHTKDFSEPEQVKLKNILIKPEGDLKDEDARVLAEKVSGFLKAGEDFDGLALKYSKGPNADMGGDIGFVKRGQMLKEIEDVVFELEPGQLSDVIKTQLGCHIFRVEEKRPATIKGLNEVRDSIEKRLFLEKGKKRYREWIEELRKNAYISIR